MVKPGLVDHKDASCYDRGSGKENTSPHKIITCICSTTTFSLEGGQFVQAWQIVSHLKEKNSRAGTWTCSRLLRSPSLDHPPAFVRWSCKHSMSNAASFAFTQIYTVWRNDRGTVWWLCSPTRHDVRDTAARTALLVASGVQNRGSQITQRSWMILLYYKQEAAYTDKHCDFLYQDLSHSTFLRATHTAVRLATTVPPSRVCFVHGHAYLGGKDNSVPKLLSKIQFPGLLYTCWVTV